MLTQEELLQHMIDREAIRDVLNRYCRAIDRCDSELLTSVYHPEAIDDHGRFIGSASEFAEYSMSRLEEWEGTFHDLGTIVIDLDGDTALSEAYVTAHHLMRREEGGKEPRFLDTFVGRYIDRFERRDGEWRIAHRVAVKLVRYSRALGESEAEQFVLGVRGRRDPAYQGPQAVDGLARG